MAQQNHWTNSANFFNQAPSETPLATSNSNSSFELPFLQMGLSELLKHPIVHELHESYMTTSQAMTDISKNLNNLVIENAKLKSELEKFKTGVYRNESMGSIPYV
jgi:hypothetical protein